MGEVKKMSWILKLDEYPYTSYSRESKNGSRHYNCDGVHVPSVTTILDKTDDKSNLKKWIKRVGEEEAERIKVESSTRGTQMHEFIENRLLGHQLELVDYQPSLAHKMGSTVLNNLIGLNFVYGTEISLNYKNLWAGSADLVCLYENQLTIGDFKQANKMKKEEWITNYFCQLVAYSMAHSEMYNEVEQGKIFMVTPELQYKEFELNKFNYEKYKKIWLDRVELYYKNKESADNQPNLHDMRIKS